MKPREAARFHLAILLSTILAVGQRLRVVPSKRLGLPRLPLRRPPLVATGDPGPVEPQAAPQPLEVILEQRGVKRLGLTGVERFLPVISHFMTSRFLCQSSRVPLQ